MEHPTGPHETWHGTLNGYRGRRCRCDQCRNANSTHNSQKHQEFKEWLAEIKSQPCVDCGNSYPPVCMDFDHRDPSIKRFIIATSGTRNRKVLLAEIAKCDLVCANCHRIRTAAQNAAGILASGRPRKV